MSRQAHTDADFADTAKLFKALAHPLRVKIICGLLEEPCTQTRIAACLGVPQSSVAQHLDVLRRAGIVEGNRFGTEVTLAIGDVRVPRVLRAACRSGGSIPLFAWEAAGRPRSRRTRPV